MSAELRWQEHAATGFFVFVESPTAEVSSSGSEGGFALKRARGVSLSG
jgi:hypothetical protein